MSALSPRPESQQGDASLNKAKEVKHLCPSNSVDLSLGNHSRLLFHPTDIYRASAMFYILSWEDKSRGFVYEFGVLVV